MQLQRRRLNLLVDEYNQYLKNRMNTDHMFEVWMRQG